MSAPSKIHNIQSVQIQPGERLAATPEQHPVRSLVTGCCEARGTGYWAATLPMKRGNARGGKGLAEEPLRQGHIHRTKRWVKDGNKTVLITYLENGREVLLKSRMRENLTSGSVRELIAASGRGWL